MELRFNSLKLAIFFCAVIFFLNWILQLQYRSTTVYQSLQYPYYSITHYFEEMFFLNIKRFADMYFFLQYLTVLILHFIRLILHIYKVTIIRIMPHPRQTKLSLGPFRETIMDPSTHVNKCMFENIYLEEQVPHFLQTIVLFPNL